MTNIQHDGHSEHKKYYLDTFFYCNVVSPFNERDRVTFAKRTVFHKMMRCDNWEKHCKRRLISLKIISWTWRSFWPFGSVSGTWWSSWAFGSVSWIDRIYDEGLRCLHRWNGLWFQEHRSEKRESEHAVFENVSDRRGRMVQHNNVWNKKKVCVFASLSCRKSFVCILTS